MTGRAVAGGDRSQALTDVALKVQRVANSIGARDYAIVGGLLELAYRPGARQKLGALVKLIKGVRTIRRGDG